MQRFREAQPPRSLWAEDSRTGRPFGDLEPPELAIALTARLPLDPDDATQAPSDPAIPRWQLAPLAEAEVAGPTAYKRVEVGDHLLQADAPMRKLAIQFIQHEIREQWREWTALRGPFPAFFEQPAIEHSGGQVSPDQPENPPVRDPRCHRGHQPVVVDPVEEFGQVDVHDKPVAFDDAGLRLRHRLMGGTARPEAVAVLAECRVPLRLKPLQDRLLDHAIDHGWNAEVARPAGRLRDLYPTHRLRLVAPLEQLIFDLRPARFEDARQLFDGDPVNAG